MERVSFRATSLLRAVVVTSLVGHWLANALFDDDQYAGAGADLLARLDDPFLVQAAFGILVLAIVSAWDRRRRSDRAQLTATKLSFVVLLICLQLVVFVGLEASERLAVEAIAGEAADVGVFGVGFLAELAVAVASAFVLLVLFEAAKRFFPRARPGLFSTTERPRRLALSHGFLPLPSTLSGAGGVRAPPA